MASCSSCRAEIVWAVNEKSGKREPIDAGPVSNGNIEIVASGEDDEGRSHVVIRHLKGDELPLFGDAPPRYISHFATCPDAKTHRKKTP